jgi:hypothetical protein
MATLLVNWNETVVNQYNVLFRHVLGGAEENHDRKSNRAPLNNHMHYRLSQPVMCQADQIREFQPLSYKSKETFRYIQPQCQVDNFFHS